MTDRADPLSLSSSIIGALPIMNTFIDRIDLKALLERYLPSATSQKLSQAVNSNDLII